VLLRTEALERADEGVRWGGSLSVAQNMLLHVTVATHHRRPGELAERNRRSSTNAIATLEPAQLKYQAEDS
jgi:hypothetical protein